MKLQTTYICLLTLFLMSCAAFEQNPILVNMTIKQGVARFCEISTDPARRAAKVDNALALAQTAISNEPSAGLSAVIDILKKEIDVSGLSKADKLLLEDLITIMRIEVQRVAKIPDIEESTAVQAMLTAARSAAAVYLP